LAAGLAVIRMLAGLDVKARMRWPNDIMVGDRKLAGLLLERHRADSVIAGIGLNLHNTPAEQDPSLKDTAVRLADLSPSLPHQDELLCRLLNRVRDVHREMEQKKFAFLLPELNRIWGPLPRPVTLTVQGKEIEGNFTGVTPEGDLLLERSGHPLEAFEAPHVHLLRERSPG
jgi:BirA family biotin operon repressor/biotin-[acetyl-CoA-carboxylase] ligase